MPDEQTNIQEELLQVPDVAAYLHVNQRTVLRMIDRGELQAFKVARQWRFRQKDVDAYLLQRMLSVSLQARKELAQQLKHSIPVWWENDAHSWQTLCEDVTSHLPDILQNVAKRIQHEQVVTRDGLQQILIDALIAQDLTGVPSNILRLSAEHIAVSITQAFAESFAAVIERIREQSPHAEEDRESLGDMHSVSSMSPLGKATMHYSYTNQSDQLFEGAEPIAVIAPSTSTSTLSSIIFPRAASKKLIGEFVVLSYIQDGIQHYAIGQIAKLIVHRAWHDNLATHSLLSLSHRAKQMDEVLDTYQGELSISAVFAYKEGRYRPSILGTVPPPGTPIHLINEELLKRLFSLYENQFFYLGRIYGSTMQLPLWFKQFDEGGLRSGDVPHIGIFGEEGSGKSVLAKMIILAYAKHKSNGIFVLDQQGKFSFGFHNQNELQDISHVLRPNVLDKLGKAYHRYDISTLQLDRWELFLKLLAGLGFFSELGIIFPPHQVHVEQHLLDLFPRGQEGSLPALNTQVFLDVLQHLSANIQDILPARQEMQERICKCINEVRNKTVEGGASSVKEKWDCAVRCFETGPGKKTPSQIVKMVLSSTSGKRPLIVVDLSQKLSGISQISWEDTIKPMLIEYFIDELTQEAEKSFLIGRSANTLVVLDDVHTLASQSSIKYVQAERLKSHFIDALRISRKYGLGWMLLSQTLADLEDEIVQQLRNLFFGFGLRWGREQQKLAALIGDKDSLDLYYSFRDPQSSFDVDSKKYPYMAFGPISPLSFSGAPLFLEAFNKVDDFIVANKLPV